MRAYQAAIFTIHHIKMHYTVIEHDAQLVQNSPSRPIHPLFHPVLLNLAQSLISWQQPDTLSDKWRGGNEKWWNSCEFLKAFLTFNAFRWQDYLFLICCCQSAQHVSGKQMGLRDTCVDLGTFKWCTVADCQRHLQGWKRLTWFSLSVLNDVWRNSDSIKMFSWFFF